MKLKTTLILLVLLALLGVGYYGMLAGKQEAIENEIKAKKCFDFSPDSVQTLEIQLIGQPAVLGERTGEDRWKILTPNPTIKAFDLMWNRVCEHFVNLSNERTLPKPKDWAEYGLDAPALRVNATLTDGTAIALTFGSLELTGRFYYASLEGENLFLVTKEQAFELNRPLAQLRHMFPVDERESPLLSLEIARIWTGRDETKLQHPPEIGSESPPILVVRDSAEDLWRMEQPDAGKADQERVNALISEIQYALCAGFIDEPESLADYGLEPANMRITLKDAATGAPQTLYLGDVDTVSEASGLFARKEGWDAVFHLPVSLLQAIPEKPLDLRDHHMLTRTVEEIVDLTYVGSGKGSFTLARDENEDNFWRLDALEVKETDQVAVSGMLSQLKLIEGAAFIKGLPDHLNPEAPQVTYTLHFNDGETAQIKFWEDPENETFHVVQQDTGDFLYFYQNFMEEMLFEMGDMRSKRLLSFDKDKVRKIQFQYDEVGYELNKVHGKWLLRGDEDRALPHPSDINVLMDVINPFYATSMECDELDDPGVYGLEAPILTVYVWLEAEAEGAMMEQLGPIKIGDTAIDAVTHRYASTWNQTGIFRIKQENLESVQEFVRILKTLQP